MAPRRYSNGVTNVASGTNFGMLGMPDPTKYLVLMKDFKRFDPGEWLITRSEPSWAQNDTVSDSSEVIGDASNGVLTITTIAKDDAYAFFQYSGSSASTASETFTLESGKKLWFRFRLKNNDVDTADFYAGVFIADTSPVASAPSDGFWFISDDGDGYLDFHIYKSSASQLSRTALATLSDNTYFDAGMYWDGVDEVHVFYNDSVVAKGTGISPTTGELSLGFGIQNGSASASTHYVDYLCVVKER